MSLKEDLKYKVKDCLNLIFNKALNCFVFGFEKFNDTYELGEAYLYADKSKSFWKVGKLYRYFKGQVKINNLLWKENPYIYKDFSFEEFDKALQDKEEDKFLYSKKLHRLRILPSYKVFLVLDNRNFNFKVSMCRIMIDNEICVIVSSSQQSKYPWNYYEEVK